MTDDEKREWIMLAIQSLLTTLLPAIIDVIQKFRKQGVTLDDVKALASMVRPPEDYFNT